MFFFRELIRLCSGLRQTLNPRRAQQTFAGKAQMEATWTNTVPRRLVLPEVGPVVTRDAVAARKVAVSTRSAARKAPETAPAPKATAPASHRFVQIGAFTDPARAKAVAQKLANAGLPARMGKITRKGQRLTLVMAGPFGTQKALETGLGRVRGMGYVQAVLRK